MLSSALLILAVSILPGWALAAILDGTADRLRKTMLAPSLGLLLLYGLSGTLFLLQLWSVWSMWLLILGLNVIAWRLVTARHENIALRTHWQRLEAAMHGEHSQEATEESVREEARFQRHFQSHRNLPFLVLSLFIALTALVSPFLQQFPFGVDWIGFAMLTRQVMAEGSFSLPGLNDGFWTYPPGFPSLAAWLATSLHLNTGVAVFHLGHWSLFALLLGLMGALDRHGAGSYAMFAMGLGIGLFAKTFDSGYPTVASQLGIIVGILVLFRASQQRQRYHTFALCVALWCVCLIHPTGAIYLALLFFSHVLHGLQLEQEEHRLWAQKIATITSIFVTIGFAVALLIIAPRLFDEAVFSEYGWQGGRTMIVYNAPLLFIACWAGVSTRHSLEGRVALTWFGLLWILSMVHLIEGLRYVPVLSLLSYTLYSMALHAYHIPLAIIVALWWSDKMALSPLEHPPIPQQSTMPHIVRHVLVGIVLASTLFANAVALQLAAHDELLALSPGDIELREQLQDLEGQVYTENMHWGYWFDAPSNIQTTSIPTLGLVHLQASLQHEATRAIYADNVTFFVEHNINYALTSPLGSIQWTLATSPYWTVHTSLDAATLWELNAEGTTIPSTLFGIAEEDCGACVARIDPWKGHKFRDTLELGKDRPFLREGRVADLDVHPPTSAKTMCIVYEVVGHPGAVWLQASSGLTRPFSALRSDAGYHQTCLEVDNVSALTTLHITWKNEEPSLWLNPLGLSGRDTVLIDETGVKWHWIEWR